MSRVDRTNSPHHVYRCFDEAGRLVYIGSTADLQGRLDTHRKTSWWAPTVVKVKATWYPDGTSAREEERRAIRDEVPRWNKSGKWVGRHRWTRDDWHDWITTLLRDGLSAQLENSIRDYASLFGEGLPENLIALVDEVRRDAERSAAERKAENLDRAAAHAARETDELRELNAELLSILTRQEALARALGVDWDDPELLDPESAIDRALAERRGGAS